MTITKPFTLFITLSSILGVLVSYNFMSAQSLWSNPTAAAPYSNTPEPLNRGEEYQYKLADLGAIRMRADEYCDADGLICVSGGSVAALGVGQTWYNFLPYRTRGVWYQNTTNQPIAVSIRTNPGASSLYYNTSASETGMVEIAGQDGDSGTYDNLYGIIPQNGYYRLSGMMPLVWSELTSAPPL